MLLTLRPFRSWRTASSQVPRQIPDGFCCTLPQVVPKAFEPGSAHVSDAPAPAHGVVESHGFAQRPHTQCPDAHAPSLTLRMVHTRGSAHRPPSAAPARRKPRVDTLEEPNAPRVPKVTPIDD